MIEKQNKFKFKYFYFELITNTPYLTLPNELLWVQVKSIHFIVAFL